MDELIDEILLETNYAANRYFVELRSGGFAKDDFIETQVQFLHAVVFFSRPMAALAAKIPTPDLRVEIVRNVWEEHGEGDPARMHGTTFREFLRRLGALESADIERRVLWPEVRIFQTTLVGACVLDEYLVGCGMMGMIERMFQEISSWIGSAVVERGWLTEAALVHYRVHQELDVKHARDFFDVLRPAWDADPRQRYEIEQGLRVGASLFDRLYNDLYRKRTRRWFRAETTGTR